MVAKTEHHIGGLYTIDLGTWSQEDLLDGPVLVYSVPSDQMVIGWIVSDVYNNSSYSCSLYTGATGMPDSAEGLVTDLFGDGGDIGAGWNRGVTDDDIYLAITGPAFGWTPLTEVPASNVKVIPSSNRDSLSVFVSDTDGITGSVEPTWVLNGSDVVVDGTVNWSFGYDVTSYSSARIRLIAVDIA